MEATTVPTTPTIGEIIEVDMSAMIGYDDYIASGNHGDPRVMVKVTQVDSDGSGFGVCHTVAPIGGHMIYWTLDSIVVRDEPKAWRHVDGLVTFV